jgi:hypothetical protein
VGKAASECLRHLEDVSRVLVTPHITSIKDVVHSGIDLEGEFSARPNDIVSVTLNSDPFKGIDMNTNELKYYVKSVKYFFTIKGKASEMTLNQLKNCEIIKFEKDSRYNA